MKFEYKVKEFAVGLIPTSGKPYGERSQSELKGFFENGGPIHKLYIEKVPVKVKAKKEKETE